MGVGGGVSRRALLAGAAVAAAGAAGCAAGRGSSNDGAATNGAASSTVVATAATGSDRDIVGNALTDEQTTLAVYRELARRNPAARNRIAPLAAVQNRHIDVLVNTLELDASPPLPIADRVSAPLDVAVVDAARKAARGRLADCRQVAAGSVASMLASMAASHSVVASEWSVA